MVSKFKKCLLLRAEKNFLTQSEKNATFFANPLKLRLALPNHHDDTLFLVGPSAAPIVSSVSGGAWIEGINHEQRHHP